MNLKLFLLWGWMSVWLQWIYHETLISVSGRLVSNLSVWETRFSRVSLFCVKTDHHHILWWCQTNCNLIAVNNQIWGPTRVLSLRMCSERSTGNMKVSRTRTCFGYISFQKEIKNIINEAFRTFKTIYNPCPFFFFAFSLLSSIRCYAYANL